LSLTNGQRLGPYEILAHIGAGGMGEVYRARDTRLERQVAIKVLPSEFSQNASLKARFDREAKTISALNHPNICTLHDIGHHEGIDFLVMEYIDGETLTDRLRKGPLPLEQVLRYGVHIATALDAAHRQGIIHRDLKPGNVMLTKSGAKLLDFGLAKESAFRSAVHSAPDDQTQQRALTAEGTMVGTFQYMAPEQLEGSEVDARSDIFALGALLYEMTTGQRAFDGKNRTSVIAAIVSSQPPPISSLLPMTPPALEHVIGRCLAKDADDRWQSAADIAGQLRWISDTGSHVAPAATRRKSASSRYLWPAAAVVLALLLATIAWKTRNGPARIAPISHFDIVAPDGRRIFLGNHHSFAIAPDETSIAFKGRTGVGSETALFLRSTSSFAAIQIEGSESVNDIAYSPDSRWVVFDSGQKIRKVSVDGGKPIDLCEVTIAVGIDWAGSRIVFNNGFSNGIWSVPDTGGEKTVLFRPDAAKKQRALLFPRMLPDGKRILFTVWSGGSFDDSVIAVRNLETGEEKIVVRGGSDARYVPTGHLVYGRAGALLAVSFDIDRLEATGAPVTVQEGVATGSQHGEVHAAWSDRGTLLFGSGGVLSDARELVWVTRSGEAAPVVSTKRDYAQPRLSPDGSAIVMTLRSSNYDIWILDVERDSVNRISLGADDSNPEWSPDGKRVSWESSRLGRTQIFQRAADGSGDEKQISNTEDGLNITSWLPDGTIALTRFDMKSPRGDIWLMSETGEQLRPWLQTPFHEAARVSRDGRWVALTSDESGRNEIYVMPFPGPGAKARLSTDGGEYPVWSPDGRELFFRQGTKVLSAGFDPTRRVMVGRPAMLFDGPYENEFDVAADGRLLMVRRDENTRTTAGIRAITGWFAELERRVPAK
jgi:eukaryotic-like serine/threonine-protein kinase